MTTKTEDTAVALENMPRVTDRSETMSIIIRFAKLNREDEGSKMRSLHETWGRKSGEETFPDFVKRHADKWLTEFETGRATIDRGVNFDKKSVELAFGPLSTANAWDLFNAIGGKVTSTGKMLGHFGKMFKDVATDVIVKGLLK